MLTRLALETGHVFSGRSSGSEGSGSGEVVFNTAMSGYQEILTDPSYCGQIVCLTYPLVGNYGIDERDFQSEKSQVSGLVVSDMCDDQGSWRTGETLPSYLLRSGVVSISGVDTRGLTMLVRDHSPLHGVISTGSETDAQLVERARSVIPLDGRDLVSQVTTRTQYSIPGPGPRVVVLDLGVKRSLIHNLTCRGCEVIVVPASTPASAIMALVPTGMVLSSGPGDPRGATDAICTARQLVGRLPMLGVCLGHQILALAMGASTERLRFGHRGANHPVREVSTGRVEITAQNHGYTVSDNSLAGLDLLVTHRNVHDNTIEGLAHDKHPIISTQFHPEACPGPQDSSREFDRFLSILEGMVAP